MSKILASFTAASFLACILLANYVTTEYGMVPVGFGLAATAGTYFAGLSFVLRDAVQDTASRLVPPRQAVHIPRSDWLAAVPVLVLIVLGAALSFSISDPFIALASGVAFLVAEISDLLVYTPLRRRGYVRAAVASNVVGAVVDTFLFLWIAGFPIAGAWQGQIVGKMAVTAIAIGLVLLVRSRRSAVTA